MNMFSKSFICIYSHKFGVRISLHPSECIAVIHVLFEHSTICAIPKVSMKSMKVQMCLKEGSTLEKAMWSPYRHDRGSNKYVNKK